MLKKRVVVLSLLLAALFCMLVLHGAAADEAAGSMEEAETFTVQVYGEDAFIKLVSYEGQAVIKQRVKDVRNSNRTTQQLDLHGFYSIEVVGDNGYRKTYDWAPSAQGYTSAMSERGTETRTSLYIFFQDAGAYTVTIMPYDISEISSYRPQETLSGWSVHPVWGVEKAENCYCISEQDEPETGIGTAASSGIGDAATGSPEIITIYCYDYASNTLGIYTQMIYSSQTVYPPEIDGYRSTETAYMEYKAGTKQVITFYYRKQGESNINGEQDDYYDPYQGLTPLYAFWSSQQFITGRTKNSDNTASWIKRMYDGDMYTVFNYTVWNSERTDEFPELTATFSNYVTLSAIGIINGNVSSYDAYYTRARAKRIRAVIHTPYNAYETTINVQDVYSRDYQIIPLDAAYSSVTSVDLYIEGFYVGDGNTKYEMNISEIQFYYGTIAGMPVQTIQPTWTPRPVQTAQPVQTVQPARIMSAAKAEEYVRRCYKYILGRDAGQNEVNNWTPKLMNGQNTPDQVARGFFNSQEFKNRRVGNEDLVKILYRVYLNREADASGLAGFKAKLDQGSTLDDVIKALVGSAEYKTVLARMYE